jgi:cytoskeletal protein CcmA (bactofilin family)
MALFSKEPEHNASPEHSHEPPPSLVSLATHSLDEENVASARDATPNLREASAALRKPVETRAYLDSRTKINGQLTFEGPAQIDGQIEGEIVARSSLVIGHGALVTAKIKAASVVVAGTVSGEITATERIEIRPSDKKSGNLAAPRIAMHEGAIFEGHCAMKPEERREEGNPTLVRSEEQMEAWTAAQKSA